MAESAAELRDRTKRFALRIMRLFRSLPPRTDAQVVGKQLLRAGTSVAANYRALCRARSHREFVAKLCVVLEEADEALLWLELIAESGMVESSKLQDILREADELVAIFAAARRTARAGGKSASRQIGKSQNGN